MKNRNSRKRDGYTLVEVSIAVVLSTLIVFAMTRWLVGISYVSKVGFQDAADKRLVLTFNQMERDIRGAEYCSGAGGGTRVPLMDADNLILTTDEDGDGIVTTVEWRRNGTSLERGTIAMAADCVPGTVVDWVPWMSNVSAFAFSAVRNGGVDAAGTAGPCDAEYVARCQMGALQIEIDVEDTTGTETLIVSLP